MVTVEPLVRTEAQQQQINQERLEAEMSNMRMIANLQQQNQDFAAFVGSKMEEIQSRQPHASYHVYNGGGATSTSAAASCGNDS